MRQILIIHILMLVFAALFSFSARAQTKLVISGVDVTVVNQTKASFDVLHDDGTRFTTTTQYVVVVIPTQKYSREIIDAVWRHFKQAYPDKKETLDLKIYTSSTYEYNKEHFPDVPWLGSGILLLGLRDDYPRKYEATFERLDITLTDGEDQELLSYVPDLDKPIERKVVVLVGKDPRR
jgi:phosphatidylserine/phosphatidylglycerophosphate/cardiolipin synthase-like enzyme